MKKGGHRENLVGEVGDLDPSRGRKHFSRADRRLILIGPIEALVPGQSVSRW